MSRVICVDIDGVLSEFTNSYTALLTKLTGITFPPSGPAFPLEWNFEASYGVTPAQVRLAWQTIEADPTFWLHLDQRPGTLNTLVRLDRRVYQELDEVYFLTHRAGAGVKQQTEHWLRSYGMRNPTVLICGDKAPILDSLGASFFIDDKPDTVLAVAEWYDWFEEDSVLKGHLYLHDAPYNQHVNQLGVQRVDSLQEALEKEGLWLSA